MKALLAILLCEYLFGLNKNSSSRREGHKMEGHLLRSLDGNEICMLYILGLKLTKSKLKLDKNENI